MSDGDTPRVKIGNLKTEFYTEPPTYSSALYARRDFLDWNFHTFLSRFTHAHTLKR